MNLGGLTTENPYPKVSRPQREILRWITTKYETQINIDINHCILTKSKRMWGLQLIWGIEILIR